MSTGQTLLVAVALFLLLRLALSSNTLFLDTGTMQQQTETIATATSLGQALIERIAIRAYDGQFARGDAVDSALYFTPPALLGRDSGEVASHDSTFDDVDDYNGFSDSVATPRLGAFHRSCEVYYVREAAPYDRSTVQTFLKRIDVHVSNATMIDARDPLKLKGPLTVSRVVTFH